MKTSRVKLAHLQSPSWVAGILILVDLDARTIRGAGLHRRCVVQGELNRSCFARNLFPAKGIICLRESGSSNLPATWEVVQP